MAHVGAMIRQRRLEQGLTLQRLAEAVGCSKAYLSGIENGRVDNPPRRQLIERLEQALQIESGQLLQVADWQLTPARIRADYQRLAAEAQASRRIAAQLRHAVTHNAGGATDLDELYRSGQLRQWIEQAGGNVDELGAVCHQVPLINKVAAGYPTDFTDLDYPVRVADEYVTCVDLSDPHAFAARVVGDSMAPDYRAGDIVVFSPLRDPASGSDCFVRLLPDHHTTFKRVYFEPDERVRLQPINSSYAAQLIDRRMISGIYPAVYRIQRLDPAG